MNENIAANNIKSLVHYDSKESTESLAKQLLQPTINYNELNKFEHELAKNSNGLNGNYPPQPKHIRFPDVPYSSELVNELMIFVYTMIATAMQFLHLYRTVWWLPESNTNRTMVK